VPINTYKLKRIISRRVEGSTSPARCSISAILKFDDDPESPHCVYCEYVSMRLAQACNIPVADGCLTISGDGHTYASLELGSPGLPLPDVVPSRRDRVAERYPSEAAALLAFDLFIGNWDRGENLKANVLTTHILLIAGFDHSHALLNVEEDPWHSIQRLNSGEPIVLFHPFFRRVRDDLFEDWASQIGKIEDDIIRSCCLMGRPFRGVSVAMQEALAEALNERKHYVSDMLTGPEFRGLLR
jgi:hypothetical protein